MDKLRQLRIFMENLVLNQSRRREVLLMFSCFLLSCVSLFMTVVNIKTREIILMWITLGFSVLCFLLFLLSFAKDSRIQMLTRYILAAGMMVLFGTFIITGHPDGFSVIWTAMLPACGLLLFEIVGGSILSALVWLMLVFFFWTPFGKSLLKFDYNTTFMTRFPMLYLAFFIIALMLAAMFYITLKSLYSMYRHDPLTKVLNRVGFNEAMAESLQSPNHPPVCGFIIADIDHFKYVNDTYGHFAGDKVLMCVADIMMSSTKNPICRWGGEEFAIFIADGQSPRAVAETIRKNVEETVMMADDVEIKITISLGYTESEWDKDVTSTVLCRDADVALYKAKDSGRNKVIGFNN